MKTKLIPSVVILSLLFQVGLLAVEQGDDNPAGVAGAFNGSITTAGSYDPYTGNASRQIDDIVVPGSVGAYPLKWTRYWNSHVTYGDSSIGASWRFSYLGYKFFASRNPCTPDGREITDAFGVEEKMGAWNGNSALFLADGGKVVYNQGYYYGSLYNYPVQIIDPYGQITTLSWVTYGYASGHWLLKLDKITEPGGRYLKINWDTTNTYITSVQAFDGVNSQPIQSVTYTWATQTLSMPDGSHPNSFKVLTRADYSDGTFAAYTNVEGNYPVPICTSPYGTDHVYVPLVATADDVRYAGPMRQIAYQYDTTKNKTRIISERNFATGEA